MSSAKCVTLLELGVPESRLQITYGKALRLNQAHMVLAYYANPAADPLVLDNLVPDILPGSSRDDLVPVYSFNGQGLWISRARGRGKRVGGSERLRSEEHTSELQSLMRISYAVFCLKKKNNTK